MKIEYLRKYRKLKGEMLLHKSELDEIILKSKTLDGCGVRSSVTSDTVAELAQTREKIRKRVEVIERKLSEDENYIDSCEAPYSTMLRLHYIDGISWTAIAMRTGGNNTQDGIRMACHRYVLKNP